MPNTYSQIYLQFVFAVRHRERAIPKEHKVELHKYITALVARRQAKLLAVHCMPDHAHLFVGFRPVISISEFIKQIKVETTELVNSKRWHRGKFSWQEGYGVFSCSHSHIDRVIKYINDQEAHHQVKSFREEYHAFLENFAVPYEERYLFEFFDLRSFWIALSSCIPNAFTFRMLNVLCILRRLLPEPYPTHVSCWKQEAPAGAGGC